jgi:hypothetical protein
MFVPGEFSFKNLFSSELQSGRWIRGVGGVFLCTVQEKNSSKWPFERDNRFLNSIPYWKIVKN